MRFRSQLIVAIAALITITSSAGIIAAVALHRSNARAAEVMRHALRDVEAVQALRLHAEQVVSAARGYLLSDDPQMQEKLAARELQFEQSLAHLGAAHRDVETAAAFAKVEQALLDYSRATANAARQRSRNQDIRELARAFDEQTVPRRQRLHAAVSDLVALERQSLTRETTRESNVVRAYSISLLIASGLGVLLSVAFACFVIRRLNAQYRRVQEAEAAATRAADARKQLVDTVAHDLLSPLNAIVLGIEVVEAGGTRFPRADIIKGSAQRMQRLVNDLLDVSRAEHMGLELACAEHEVTEIVRAAADQFRDSAQRRDVRLRTEAVPATRAFVDRDRVLQVFSNLIGNALKFARKGDEITVGAAAYDEGAVRFFVTDTGPGIPPTEVDQLFEAYRQGAGRARRGSLGLGLHISKTLVEAHGGRIGVDTVDGKGSTFWFEIPAPRSAAA